MDKLDQEIEEKRRRRAEAKLIFDQLDLEVRTLERAAALRPSLPNVDIPEAMSTLWGQPRKGGKPAGAINMAWRKVLARFKDFEGPIPAQDFYESAKSAGIDSSIDSVRDRLRRFVVLGYLTGDANSGFAVTRAAVEKFDLNRITWASSEESEEAH